MERTCVGNILFYIFMTSYRAYHCISDPVLLHSTPLLSTPVCHAQLLHSSAPPQTQLALPLHNTLFLLSLSPSSTLPLQRAFIPLMHVAILPTHTSSIWPLPLSPLRPTLAAASLRSHITLPVRGFICILTIRTG